MILWMTLKTLCLCLHSFKGLCYMVVFGSSGGDLVLLVAPFHMCLFWALVLYVNGKGRYCRVSVY